MSVLFLSAAHDAPSHAPAILFISTKHCSLYFLQKNSYFLKKKLSTRNSSSSALSPPKTMIRQQISKALNTGASRGIMFQGRGTCPKFGHPPPRPTIRVSWPKQIPSGGGIRLVLPSHKKVKPLATVQTTGSPVSKPKSRTASYDAQCEQMRNTTQPQTDKWPLRWCSYSSLRRLKWRRRTGRSILHSSTRSSAQGNCSAKSLAGNVTDSSLSSRSSMGGGRFWGQGGLGAGGFESRGVEVEGGQGSGDISATLPCTALPHGASP